RFTLNTQYPASASVPDRPAQSAYELTSVPLDSRTGLGCSGLGSQPQSLVCGGMTVGRAPEYVSAVTMLGCGGPVGSCSGTSAACAGAPSPRPRTPRPRTPMPRTMP